MRRPSHPNDHDNVGCSIIPSCREVPPHKLSAVDIFTDGSKVVSRSAFAVACLDGRDNLLLPVRACRVSDYFSVYAGEMLAIEIALNEVEKQGWFDCTIYSDSKAGLSSFKSLKLLNSCKFISSIQDKLLAREAEGKKIALRWVCGSSGIFCNEIANRPANGAFSSVCVDFNCALPRNVC